VSFFNVEYSVFIEEPAPAGEFPGVRILGPFTPWREAYDAVKKLLDSGEATYGEICLKKTGYVTNKMGRSQYEQSDGTNT